MVDGPLPRSHRPQPIMPRSQAWQKRKCGAGRAAKKHTCPKRQDPASPAAQHEHARLFAANLRHNIQQGGRAMHHLLRAASFVFRSWLVLRGFNPRFSHLAFQPWQWPASQRGTVFPTAKEPAIWHDLVALLAARAGLGQALLKKLFRGVFHVERLSHPRGRASRPGH